MNLRRSRLLGTSFLACALAAAGGGILACGTAFNAETGDGGSSQQDGATNDAPAEGTQPIGQDGSNESAPAGDATLDQATGDGTVAEGSLEGGTDGGSGEAGSSEGGTTEGGTEGGANEGGVEAGCALGQACVPAPPAGFSGPIQFYYGAAAAPSCPPQTSATFAGGTGLDAGPPSCSACTCGAPTGEACQVSLGMEDNQSGCPNSPCTTVTVGSSCVPINPNCPNGLTTSFATGTALPAGGQCAASPQTGTAPPTSWSSSAQGCTPGGTPPSCGAGEVCTPTAASSYKICVYQSGDVLCPSTGYTNKQLVYGGVADTRGCSACTCGDPGGGACGDGGLTFYGNTTCSSVTSQVRPLPELCDVINKVVPNSVEFSARPPVIDGGACAADGGVPGGQALPSVPITVCCGP